MVFAAGSKLVGASSESLIVDVSDQLRAIKFGGQAVPGGSARFAHLDFAICHSGMPVRCVHNNPQRVGWVGGEKRKIRWLRVEANRDRDGRIRFALISGGILEPDEEAVVAWRWREDARELVYPFLVLVPRDAHAPSVRQSFQ